MAPDLASHRPVVLPLFVLLVLALGSASALAHAESKPGGCPFSHDHDDDHHHHHHHQESDAEWRRKLPEELAEEEDLKLGWFIDDDHHQKLRETSSIGVWMSAMGCSLLVSTASLICLVLLPVIFWKGSPSKTVVNSLAMFGAGAMLGDAFLHQLPHAFSGGHSYSLEHEIHEHHHNHKGGHSHGHSLQDLSVGLSVLAGIVMFLLVEKLVRYIENASVRGSQTGGHGHHLHGHRHNKFNIDEISVSNQIVSSDSESKKVSDVAYKEKLQDGTDACLEDEKPSQPAASLRKRAQSSGVDGNALDTNGFDSALACAVKENASSNNVLSCSHPNLVFGYLNLFSDGVHNFTDGMALGSAFLLYGPIGGWSRTLFLLAHELPQEIGDFGILVHSGFTVPKALLFNFLSALAALLGTALALVLGKDPGHSSLIEGFTAGGFIYIAAAGVLPEMNSGSTNFRSTAAQLISLMSGIGVALAISLSE